MRWDETTSIPRPERVSPWKIEPALAPPVNPLPVPRPKRPRTNVIPSSPDSSVLTREGYILNSQVYDYQDWFKDQNDLNLHMLYSF